MRNRITLLILRDDFIAFLSQLFLLAGKSGHGRLKITVLKILASQIVGLIDFGDGISFLIVGQNLIVLFLKFCDSPGRFGFLFVQIVFRFRFSLLRKGYRNPLTGNQSQKADQNEGKGSIHHTPEGKTKALRLFLRRNHTEIPHM